MRIILLKLFSELAKKNLQSSKIGVLFGVSGEKIFLHQIGIIIMKHNAHVVAYKKAVARNELSKARMTLAKWALQTKCGIKF